jgi:uncharacterized protein (TIGR03066 family)
MCKGVGMRQIHTLVVMAFAFVIAGCATDSMNQDDSPAGQLVGEWESEPMQTEIGPGQIHFTFTEDGRYTIHFETKQFRSPKREGTYAVEGNQLITSGEQHRDVSRFWFEDEVLVIPDGSEIVRLSRR